MSDDDNDEDEYQFDEQISNDLQGEGGEDELEDD